MEVHSKEVEVKEKNTPIKTDDKHKTFCSEYIKDRNGTRAAIAAGYAEKTAGQAASRLLKNVKILDLIIKLTDKRNEATKTDAEYVINRLREIDQLDIKDILNDEMDAFRPIKEWPRSWRISISGVDIQHMFSGGDEPIEKIVKKIKWPDKTKNLEMIGRHVDVSAFKDRVEHKHVIEDMTEDALERRIKELTNA